MNLPQEFIDWAEANGVSLDHPDDYMPWFDCWKDGYDNGHNAQKETEDG